MLRMSVSYADDAGQATPIVATLNPSIVRSSVEDIIDDYLDGARKCPDRVLAALLRAEAQLARSVLLAAGLPVRMADDLVTGGDDGRP